MDSAERRVAAEVFATCALRIASRPEFSWLWWVGIVAVYGTAFFLLFATLSRGAPLAVAYAIWTGVGVALTAVVAWVAFKEALPPGAMVGIALVIAGVILIEVFSSGHAH